MAKKKSDIKPGGITEYIAKCPHDAQVMMKSIRAVIRKAAPDAVDTVSYFQMPGYHYAGDYAYNGMFAWFSCKKPYVRLHVWPQVIKDHKEVLADFVTSTAIVFFPLDKKISVTLVRRLVKASLKVLKDTA